MSESNEDDDLGCFIFIVGIIVGIGAGLVWGVGYGALATGLTMLAMFLAILLLARR